MGHLRETEAIIKVLHDYVIPTIMNVIFGIWRPFISTNNFKIKLTIIQMIQVNQFSGALAEDPNSYIANFLEIYDTLKHDGASNDAIRLGLFPFLLKDKTKS